MTQYYSRKDYEYAGDSNFTIPFSYISKDDINVYVNDEEITTWTWLNDSQINISSTLTTGDMVSIRRNTPIDEKIVTYQNMSMVLNDDNLNLSQDQILNAVQEMYDNNVTFEIEVENNIDAIEETANTALSNSQTAITTANTADSKADTAVSTANTANNKADNAVSTANSANSSATNAVNTANSAVNTANGASNTATTASNKVDAFGEDIASVISAAEKINELEEAVQTATTAATTASNKADVATNKATEATNAANRAEAIIPTQTGQNGKYLKTNGTSTSWEDVDLSSKQDVLVSGTNIKTINNNSILGSGNIDMDSLPSQTGQGGKYLTTDGTDASWGDVDTGSSRNIGEIVASTIPLTNAGLHLLDGSLIQGSGSYGAFVDYIADLVTDYPDLFDTEANWQTAVTTYGVCGKFVYDSINNTVRLPRITGFTEGTVDTETLGYLTEAGLPDITHTHTQRYSSYSSAKRFAATSSYSYVPTYDYMNTSTNSAVSPIYGRSSTVQPQSVKVLYYIVIATTTKTSIEVDIDEIATDLNGKADVDLTNTLGSWSSSSKDYVTALVHEVDWDNVIEVSTTSSGQWQTYTAPSDGLFITCVYCSADSGISCAIDSSNSSNPPVTGCTSGGYVSSYRRTASASEYIIQGQEIKYCMYANANIVYISARFVPLKKS